MEDELFKRDVIDRLARIEEKQKASPCKGHEGRLKSLENSRVKLMLGIAGIGGLSGVAGSQTFAWLKALFQ